MMKPPLGKVPVDNQVLDGHAELLAVLFIDVVFLLIVIGLVLSLFCSILIDDLEELLGLHVEGFDTVLDVEGLFEVVLCILL